MYAARLPACTRRSLQPASASWDSSYQGTSDALAEHFSGPVSFTLLCPEAALMCAVLEDAFLCFQKRVETDMRSNQQAREAEEWFFSDDSHWLFSFVSVCDVLGLEPEFLRKGLKHWSQSHAARAQRKQRNRLRFVGARQPSR